MKRVILFTLLLFFSTFSRSQTQNENTSDVLVIDTVYAGTGSKGDMITLVVSNISEDDRGFTVEIVASEENNYWSTIYSASINNDSFFFKQWRDAKKLSKKMNIQYVLPKYNRIFYHIEAGETQELQLRITGKSFQKGMELRVLITTDIAEDDPDTIYSSAFKVYTQPD
ncbi:MAG: hypothetical protein KF862_13340 [Chitinophagaceae bacterium]|nr:hypothetical protein [Chitinophagaceae bacterium]